MSGNSPGRSGMAVIKDVERPEYVFVGSETEVLRRMLDHYRATLLWKCEGLDEDQLRQVGCAVGALAIRAAPAPDRS